MTAVIDQSLATIASALRSNRVSATSLNETAIERYTGAVLGAYYAWQPDLARRQATAADICFATGNDLGPLQGIPISVKDHYGVQGFPTYAGTALALPASWQREGAIIRGLRHQLAVIIGKTVAVELAFGGIGLNHHWGTPRNPWDARSHRVSGGSSSGAGVSLWEGSALLALGTDTGGSVRIPASMTGTVGLKTSYSRWSLDGIVPLSPTLDTAGILTRTVADAIYAFAAIDPGTAAPAELLRRLDLQNPNEFCLGIGNHLLWEHCSPGIVETVQEALDEATRHGLKVCDAPLPQTADALALLRSGSVVSAQCDAFIETELPDWRARLDPIITSRIADGGTIPAREYLLRQHRIAQLSASAQQQFTAVDVIVTPTVPITPPRLEELSDIDEYRRLNMLSLRNTCIANFLGLCGLSIPVGLDHADLPVGLQLLAPHGQEEKLLAVGLALEKVLGTARERLGTPPLP